MSRGNETRRKTLKKYLSNHKPFIVDGKEYIYFAVKGRYRLMEV